MSVSPHVHKFEVPTTIKVRLSNYRLEDGVTTSEHSGYDILKVRQCKCEKAYEAYDLERNLGI